MIDIRFISVLPVQTIPGAQSVQPSQGGAPQAPINFPTGSILSGFIVNRDASGNPILRTEKADIVFATNFFLKIGSEVVIRLENRAGRQQAHILSVNCQPPEIAEQQSAFDEPEVIVGNERQPQSTRGQAAAPAEAAVITRSANAGVSSGVIIAPPPSATCPSSRRSTPPISPI